MNILKYVILVPVKKKCVKIKNSVAVVLANWMEILSCCAQSQSYQEDCTNANLTFLFLTFNAISRETVTGPDGKEQIMRI